MALSQVGLERLNTATTKKLGTNKNLIINGAMQVAQRGTSSTTNGYGSVDRFAIENSGVDEAPTHSQIDLTSSDTPFSLGFKKALRITNGNQTSVGTSDFINLSQPIEAQNIAQSGWNFTSSSSYVTLSFWVRSSISQDFKGYISMEDGTERSYPYSTGTLSVNTWTKITKIIPGSSSPLLQCDVNNQKGFTFLLWPFIGSALTDNSVTENAWMTFSGSTRTKDSASNWYEADNATFDITGVQLEVGSVATDFEHRSIGEELLRCQRYYQVIVEGTNKAICNAVSFTGNNGFGFIDLKTTMRAAPTLDVETGTGYWRAFRNGGTGDFNDVIMESNSIGTVGLKFQGVSSGSSLNTDQVGFMRTNNSAAFLAASSEL